MLVSISRHRGLHSSPYWSITDDGLEKLRASLNALNVSDEALAQVERDTDGDIDVRNSVAVIPVMGPMMKGVGIVGRILGIADTGEIARDIDDAVSRQNVDSIMLLVDSPGGSVDGLAELTDAVFRARDQKRVVVQSDGMIASAAFQMASQATEIRAQRMDLIGSLGARLLLFDMSKLAENEGIKAIPIDTSPEDRPFKSAAAPGTEITEAQQADFQRIVNAFGEDFKEALRRGRGMSNAQIDQVFDGRIFTAEAEALPLGLIDQIRTVRETLDELQGESEQRERTAQARLRLMQMQCCSEAQSSQKPEAPFANEHSCRLQDPSQFARFRRQNNWQEKDGKRIDAIFGIRSGQDNAELQALRYPTSQWSESQARSDCRERDSIMFEPARDSQDSATATA